MTAAVVAVVGLGAGMATGSDAASPFDVYYVGWPGGGNQTNTEPDEQGPAIARKGVTTTVRSSRSGTFVFNAGTFSENVRGSVAFATVGAVSAKKPRKRRLSLGRKAFRAQRGRPARVSVRLSRTSRGVLRRYRKLKVRARISAQDTNLNTTERAFTFTLKRPR